MKQSSSFLGVITNGTKNQNKANSYGYGYGYGYGYVTPIIHTQITHIKAIQIFQKKMKKKKI